METEKQGRVFDEWDVDCNDCSHYWNNDCDALSEGSRRLCNSFSATRRVILPLQIERLEKAVRGLRIGLVITAGVALGQLILIFGKLLGVL